MAKWLIITSSISTLIFLIIIYRGNKQVKCRDSILENMARVENSEIEHIGYLSYQGGFSQIPKPQKMNIALSDDYLVMVTKEGIKGKVDYARFRKCDKFTTKKHPDLRGRSIVLWGPLVGAFLKPKIRHFMVINYLDINKEENNILLECKDANELEMINEKVEKTWKSYKWRHAKESNLKTVAGKL